MRYASHELRDGVHWIGAKDWDRRMFDALIPLPQGTSYNAYFVDGGEKRALVDTVNPGFEAELLSKVEASLDGRALDYVVMNHAEPDHAGAIPSVLEAYPAAELVTTAKGLEMARSLYHVSTDRVQVVENGSVLQLGQKTLQFIEAPFLHWPETMFTYAVEDEVLFSCDFFGAHTASGMYDRDVPDLLTLAKRYFGEIMMPYRKMGAKALEKIRDLPLDMIAPSHGPIYTDPERILAPHRVWTQGQTTEKVLIAYVSMWGATKAMVGTIASELLQGGIDVVVYDLATADIGEIARDLVDARAIVLGTPTVLGDLHPVAGFGLSLVKALRPPAKFAAAVSSYGWIGKAVERIQDTLGDTALEIVGAVEVNGSPQDQEVEEAAVLGRELVMRVRGEVAQ